MSWQSYIDQSLLGTGQVAKAAIHGLDGSPWATSNGFKVTPEQVQKIVNAFNSGTLAEFYTSGLFIGDEADNKYKFLRQNESSIYVKKGEAGACVYLTKSCEWCILYHPKVPARLWLDRPKAEGISNPLEGWD